MLQNMIVLENCLHFVDNGELDDSYNKAAKIQPILEKLVECFKLLCQLECNISTDDSPLLWKDILAGNNTFLKRDHISYQKQLFCQKDLLSMFGTLFCTQVVIMLIENIDSDTMQPRQYSH